MFYIPGCDAVAFPAKTVGNKNRRFISQTAIMPRFLLKNPSGAVETMRFRVIIIVRSQHAESIYGRKFYDFKQHTARLD